MTRKQEVRISLARDWSSFDSETDSGFDTSDEGLCEEPIKNPSIDPQPGVNKSNMPNSALGDWQADDVDEEVSRILCSELKSEFCRKLSPWNSCEFGTNILSPVQFHHKPPDHVIRPTLVR